MNFYSTLFTIVFLSLISSGYAQETCKLRGEIRDGDGFPVYDAAISAFNSNDEGVGFTFSDIEGHFTLEVPCGDTYDIDVEHINFESHTEKIEIKQSKNIKFSLKESVISLDQALIIAKQPITVKGDTIEYDADSFRTAADENLEDILKKLPGIQVENGKVYHEGKEIKSIKVGNREVLGGNTKLLTKNLPAEAIDKVQLNKKFKKNPFANSLQDEEEAILNIELKENKKSLVFGNITLGGDADKHADGQAKLFYFSPKTDGTFISDYNTYGKEVFTPEDYFTFLGGVSELMEEGSSFSLRESPQNIMLGVSQNAAEMNSLLSALHFGYEPSKKVYTNGFVLLNNNNLKFKSTQERIGEFRTRDEQYNDQHLLSTLGRFRIDYNPGSNSQYKYRLSFNYLENEDLQNADTYLNDVASGNRNSRTDKNSFSLRQNLSWIKKVGSNDNFGVYLRHQFMDDRPDLKINTDMIPLQIDGLDFYNLKQQRKFNLNNLQVYAIYNHLINNTTNIRFKAGSNFSFQHLNNSIYENQTLIDQADFLTNSKFNYREFYGDLTLTKKWGIFKVDLGAGVHNFYEETNTLSNSHKVNETKVLPHANLEVKFSNTQQLLLGYQQQYKLPNLVDLSDGYEVQSYYSIYRGFLGLKESLYHTANIRYGYFNSFKFLNYYVGATYNQSIDNLQTASSMLGSVQYNSLINNPHDDQSLTGYFGFNKRFSRYYSLNFNGNISYLDYHTRIEFLDQNLNLISDWTNNSSFIQNYTLTNQFKYRKKAELDLGLNYSRNEFKSLVNSEFTTWRPFAKFAWSINKKLLLQSDYSYRIQYEESKLINENQSLNANLRFNVAKATYLTFIAGNILGNERIVNTSFDSNLNNTVINTKEVLGRYFLLQLRYKF